MTKRRRLRKEGISRTLHDGENKEGRIEDGGTIDEENITVGMVEEERGDIVGGSGPYREAATTLASATLRATDTTHNHLVFFILLPVVPHTCCLPSSQRNVYSFCETGA